MAASITSRETNRAVARILIVDDHPVVRQGLKMMLESQSDLSVCAEADGMSQAMQLFAETRPDVVIADLSLQSGSGLELVKELIARDERVKVLVCSMHDESLFAERALHAGARGYINKEETPDKLIAAVRRVLSGRVYLSERMTDRMLSRQVRAGEDGSGWSIDSLSDRELEVFERIGHGITTRKIAESLQLSPKTVETYRENIKHKLGLSNATELTRHAVQWVLESSQPGPPDSAGR